MFPAKSAAALQGNKYLNTIYATTSGLRKLALVTCMPKGGKVYRGMAGLKLPEKFLKAIAAVSNSDSCQQRYAISLFKLYVDGNLR